MSACVLINPNLTFNLRCLWMDSSLQEPDMKFWWARSSPMKLKCTLRYLILKLHDNEFMCSGTVFLLTYKNGNINSNICLNKGRRSRALLISWLKTRILREKMIGFGTLVTNCMWKGKKLHLVLFIVNAFLWFGPTSHVYGMIKFMYRMEVWFHWHIWYWLWAVIKQLVWVRHKRGVWST